MRERNKENEQEGVPQAAHPLPPQNEGVVQILNETETAANSPFLEGAEQ